MLRLLLLGLSTLLPTLALADFEGTPIGKVRVGAAAVELHATDDMVVAGTTHPRKLSGQDGMLRAVATVIQGPPRDTRVAIVALDIIAIGRKHLDAAAKQIEQKTGIPFDHILINCTHTHQVPSTIRIFDYDAVPEFVAQVESAIVESVVQANSRLNSSPPTRMLFMMGHENTVGDNSRIEMRDGTIGYPPFPIEEQLRPTGPVDPDFPVMVFKRPDRSLAAVIFGHSTHNVGTPHFDRRSPDIYGLAAQAFEQDTGVVTTFIEGAAGSTIPFEMDGVWPRDVATGVQLGVEAERHILDAIRYHVDQAPEMAVVRIGSIKREISVSVRDFDEKREEQAAIAASKRTISDAPGEKGAAMFRQMRAELAPHRGEKRKTWLSVTRIGDVAIVGVPAELFAQLGMDIKRRSPFRYTIIAELANDWVGYVGNADAYRLGGYQVQMGLHSWTERGTGELFVNESVKLLEELYAQ